MTRILPPGPFPPTGDEPTGAIDLGVRLRDTLYTRDHIDGVVRPDLADQLSTALQAGELERAAGIAEAFVETWPVAALVEQARSTWTAEPDGEGLAVLDRAARLVAKAASWDTLRTGAWPLPDAETLREHAGDGPHEVIRRCLGDGAEETAAALGCKVSGSEPLALPAYEEITGERLAARRDPLARRLARGELAAVLLTSPVPDDPSSQLALGELRMESDYQRGVERYGLAGLLAPDAPAWSELLLPAPAGTPGETLQTTCDWALFPGTPGDLRRGTPRPVAYLLWDGPHAPLAVEAGVARLLSELRHGATVDAICEATGQPRAQVAPVVEELLQLGALTAIEAGEAAD